MDLEQIQSAALNEAERVNSMDALAQVRAQFLGKKGELGLALRAVSKLPKDKRPEAGKRINEVKQAVEVAFVEAQRRLEAEAEAKALAQGRVDVTLPGRRVLPGAAHPLRIIEGELIRCFSGLGFEVVDGPEIEDEWYNFDALNMPVDHPARDMQDTFFVAPRVVLRTHTSNLQIRTMQARQPPVRILAPGMVYRNDPLDATHSPVFHQMEGLWIDERATFADLKGVLRRMAEALFGPSTEIRLRPSFFPFTEPSVEVDVKFGGSWLELLGAGMVDPAVLEIVGYDPERVQGFAFGVGLERLALMKWGIQDIRLLYENDVRFLRQFSGVGTQRRES